MKIGIPPIPPRPLCLVDDWLYSSTVTEADYSAFNQTSTYRQEDRVMRASPTATVTFTAGVFGAVNWEFNQLALDTPIKFTTTGTLPTEVVSGTIYYVVNPDTNKLSIALKPRGAAIPISGAGSGTHTAAATRHDIYEAAFTITKAGILEASISDVAREITVDAYDSWYGDYVEAGMLVAAATGKKVLRRTSDAGSGYGGFTLSTGSTTASSSQYNFIWPLTNAEKWPRVGSTNRWRMFDNSVASATTAWGSLTVELRPLGTFTGIYIKAMTGTCQIQVRNSSATLLYDETYTFDTNDILGNFYDDLPSITDPRITVIFTNTSSLVAVYNCIPLTMLELGNDADYGAGSSILDFSRKVEDYFGNSALEERKNSSSMEITFKIPLANVDQFDDIVKQHKAAPLFYSAANDRRTLQLFGWMPSYRTIARFPTHNEVSCTIEELL